MHKNAFAANMPRTPFNLNISLEIIIYQLQEAGVQKGVFGA